MDYSNNADLEGTEVINDKTHIELAGFTAHFNGHQAEGLNPASFHVVSKDGMR
jgi:hypothetical protein